MFRSYVITIVRQYANIRMFDTRVIARNVCTNRIDYADTRNLKTDKQGERHVNIFMNAIGSKDRINTRLRLAGYSMYENVPNKVPYLEWYKFLGLPDNFKSWFAITELHVWMLLVRCMAENSAVSISEDEKYSKGDGYFVRNFIIEAMWADVGKKIKLLEGANPVLAREEVSVLSQQFQTSLIAYDEGLEDDKILAGAIWRRFYSTCHDIEARRIAKIIEFIRHQISELDKIPSDHLKYRPDIKWVRTHETFLKIKSKKK